VVSVMDPYGRILGFLDRTCYIKKRSFESQNNTHLHLSFLFIYLFVVYFTCIQILVTNILRIKSAIYWLAMYISHEPGKETVIITIGASI
jgi:hypothetical protein